MNQEALNNWRGKLFHFFQLWNNQMYPEVIVISFIHLQKRNLLAKFGGCGLKNRTASYIANFLLRQMLFAMIFLPFFIYAKSSEYLERKAFSFFSISKQSDVSRYDSNIIFTSTKKKQICQVWRAWLKKCPCHALEKFLMVKGMAASFFRLCLSNLVKSWNLMSTDTGENLVLISQTIFE